MVAYCFFNLALSGLQFSYIYAKMDTFQLKTTPFMCSLIYQKFIDWSTNDLTLERRNVITCSKMSRQKWTHCSTILEKCTPKHHSLTLPYNLLSRIFSEKLSGSNNVPPLPSTTMQKIGKILRAVLKKK